MPRVYSASGTGGERIPRTGCEPARAVSIARRLPRPAGRAGEKSTRNRLASPVSAHDVNQTGLARSLDAVVEDCVNAAGVDVNTASAPLLTRVSGLTPSLANSIVAWRRQRRRQPRATETVPPRRQTRTGRRLPAHQQWRQPARPPSGAPGSLSGGRAHPETMRPPGGFRIHRRLGLLKSTRSRAVHRPTFRPADGEDILAEPGNLGRDPRPEFKPPSSRKRGKRSAT